MKIVYHCFGGSHSSVTAAGIHLGMLPSYRVPEAAELERLPYFDAQVASDHGILRFFGEDEHGNQVYIVGRRNLEFFYENMVSGLLEMTGADVADIKFINTMPCVNLLMKIGGFSSRRLGMVKPGRGLVIIGIRMAYPKFLGLIRKVKWGKNPRRRVELGENPLI